MEAIVIGLTISEFTLVKFNLKTEWIKYFVRMCLF